MYSTIRAIHRTILMRTPSPQTCPVFEQGTCDVAAEVAIFLASRAQNFPRTTRTLRDQRHSRKDRVASRVYAPACGNRVKRIPPGVFSQQTRSDEPRDMKPAPKCCHPISFKIYIS